MAQLVKHLLWGVSLVLSWVSGTCVKAGCERSSVRVSSDHMCTFSPSSYVVAYSHPQLQFLESQCLLTSRDNRHGCSAYLYTDVKYSHIKQNNWLSSLVWWFMPVILAYEHIRGYGRKISIWGRLRMVSLLFDSHPLSLLSFPSPLCSCICSSVHVHTHVDVFVCLY